MRQGNTISPKFIPLGYMFKKNKLEDMGINVDGRNLQHLRIADDIVLISDNFDKGSYNIGRRDFKKLANELKVTERAMERVMLSTTLRDRIPNDEILRRTQVIDVMERVDHLKWSLAGCIVVRYGPNEQWNGYPDMRQEELEDATN